MSVYNIAVSHISAEFDLPHYMPENRPLMDYQVQTALSDLPGCMYTFILDP